MERTRKIGNADNERINDETRRARETRYANNNYIQARAREIVDGFSRNDVFLRSLIANVTQNGIFADSLDYKGLLVEGYRIKEEAGRILRSREREEDVKRLYRDLGRPKKTQVYVQGELFSD